MLLSMLLDCIGQLLILGLIIYFQLFFNLQIGGTTLDGQFGWVLFSVLLYPLLGWLFGSFTVLRWRRLPLQVLFQRLFLTGAVSLIVVAVARWLTNPPDSAWLVYRRVQFVWIVSLSFWALLVRLLLRRGLLLSDAPRLLLFAQQEDIPSVLKAWRRVAHISRLTPVDASRLQRRLDNVYQPLVVAVSPEVLHDSRKRSLLESIETRDPRLVRCVSVLTLFEQQQGRLPPSLIRNASFSYDDLPGLPHSVFRLS